jgi:hypothetical protein
MLGPLRPGAGSCAATPSIPIPDVTRAAARWMLGPGPMGPGEPEHPRRRLHGHGGVVREAAGLRAEDYRWRSSETGRRVRRARKRHMPGPARARQDQGGTSIPGANLHIKDHGRMDRGPRMWKDGGVHGSAGP